MSVKHDWQDGEKVTAADLNEIAEAINEKVIGTNDGTNWTSLTIDGTEMAIPNGDELTAGNGIDITNSVISVDNTIALKSEIPTATSDLTNDSGFITSSYHDSTKQDNLPTTTTGFIKYNETLGDFQIDTNTYTSSEDFSQLAQDVAVLGTRMTSLTSRVGSVENGLEDTAEAVVAEAQVARAAELELNQKWDAQAEAIAELSTGKQNTLTAGTNITIVNDVISATRAIESVNGQTGAVVLDASDINTEDDITIDEAISGIKTDITGLDTGKQDKITSSNKLSYNLLSDTPTIPAATSDLTNDSGFITSSYHDSTKQDVLTAGQNISIVNNVISATGGSTLPERLSLGYNLVINVNGVQFDTGNATWSPLSSGYRVLYKNSSKTIKGDYEYAQEYLSFMTGNSAVDEYDADKPTPVFIILNSNNTVWKIQWDTANSELRAYEVNNFPLQFKLTAGENITIENNVISATGGGQPQFEQVIAKMEDCIDQQRSTQDYICFRFNYEINTFFPIQIVLEEQSTYNIRGALSFFGGAVLKFNSSTYATGARVESLEGLEIGSGSGDNYIIIGRDELEAFSRYDEEHTGDNYYFILYKIVGNTKSGCIEV